MSERSDSSDTSRTTEKELQNVMFTLHHDPERLHQAVLAACIRAGCTCRPDVELEEHGVHGVYAAHVSHESTCRLLLARLAHLN